MGKKKTRRAVRVDDKSGPWGEGGTPIYSAEQVKTIMESPDQLKFSSNVRSTVGELGELLGVNRKKLEETYGQIAQEQYGTMITAYLDQIVAKTAGDRVVAYLDSLPGDKQAVAEKAIRHAIALGIYSERTGWRSVQLLALDGCKAIEARRSGGKGRRLLKRR